ncbi:pantothenate kinase [Oceanobacillus limi]|uniref:Pantothenate kinase n=1 Tax=Oceanobacillus limi TaxID=930131 RepID=A0A1I0G987_9BACI|nr:type II pantothenate kinase [Oceanobacillus limi]SET67327.1 pantothenate kinase [Oceanobacillus limi]
MGDRIGIDVGGSLVKVAYEERGHIHTKIFSNQEIDELIQWLQLIAPRATLYLTGGKSGVLMEKLNHKMVQVEEFEATTEGAKYLLQIEKQVIKDHFILVSIGTGTSIYSVTEDSYDRLLGSGIGGGTFMGLGNLLTGESDFRKLRDLASQGDATKCDLLVRDIYAPHEAPLNGDLTAANFGKVFTEKAENIDDRMASLVKLIGETILLLSTQAASSTQVEQIVFVGSTLNGNKPLKNVLTSFQNLLPYEPIFLEKGSHAGAIGALFL